MADDETQKTGSTDKSQKTQEFSQWMVDESKSGDGEQQTEASHTYTPGQSGHIDLAGLFQQQDGELDIQDEDLVGFSQPNVYTELFPESQRFQLPKTPATNGEKRYHAGEMVEHVFTTPRLPSNPFAVREERSSGPMKLSQVFRATQAPSSPLANVLPSDATSDRPSPSMFDQPVHANELPSDLVSDKLSPEMYRRHRPSTAQSHSSPTKLGRGTLQRSVTEPHSHYVTMKESQEERDRMAQKKREKEAELQKTTFPVRVPEISDDELESSQIRRLKKRRRLADDVKAKFDSISIKARPGSSSSSRIRKAGPRRQVLHSSPIRGKTQRNAVLISDEANDNDDATTEEETEHEDLPESPEAELPDELGEDNKENADVHAMHHPAKGTPLKRKAHYIRSPIPPSSYAPRRTQPINDHESPDELVEDEDPPRLFGLSQRRSSATGGPQTVTIADSQASQSKGRQREAASNKPSNSSAESRHLIPQSPSIKIPNTSQPCVSSTQDISPVSPKKTVTPPPSSPVQDDVSSPTLRRSPRKRADPQRKTPSAEMPSSPPVLPSRATGPISAQEFLDNHDDQLSGSVQEQATDNALPNSISPTLPQGPRSTRALLEQRSDHLQRATPRAPKESLPSTIPETISAPRGGARIQSLTSSPTGSTIHAAKNSSERPGDRAHGSSSIEHSTEFNTVATHLSKSSVKTFTHAHSQPSPTRSPVKPGLRKPRTFAEMANDPSPSDELADIDIDIEIMTGADKEFKERMAQLEASSPIPPARKRRKRTSGEILHLYEPSSDQVQGIEHPLPAPPHAAAQPGSVCPDIYQTDELAKDNSGPASPVRSQPKEKAAKENAAPGLPGSTLNVTHPPMAPEKHIPPLKIPSIKATRQPENDGSMKRSSPLPDHPPKRQKLGPPKSTLSNAKAQATPKTDNPPLNISAHQAIVPERVFARFNGTPAGFFPATCLSDATPGSRYKIRFDDGTTTTVSTSAVKRLELQEGDHVKVYREGQRGNTYVVKDLRDKSEGNSVKTAKSGNSTDIFGHRSVLLSLKQKPGSESTNKDEAVPITEVYLTLSMWSSLKDRKYNHSTTTGTYLNGIETPCENSSTPSTPSSRLRTSRMMDKAPTTQRMQPTPQPDAAGGSGLFAGIAFAITSIADPAIRVNTESLVRTNSGTLLTSSNGFDELFEIPPASNSSTSSTPSPSPSPSSSPDPDFQPSSTNLPSKPPTTATTNREIAFALSPSFQATHSAFLLADKHCRSTKFFQALALNIPCVATRYPFDCIAAGRLLDWCPYLLASGESSFLDGAVCSRTLKTPTGTDGFVGLEDMVGRREKWLEEKKVLLVGGGERGGKKRVKAYVFIAYALGAREVGVVESREEARNLLRQGEVEGEDWDLICVHEEEKGEGSGGSTGGRKRKRRSSGGGVGKEMSLADGLGPVGRARVAGTEVVVQSLIIGRFLEG